MHPSWKWLIPAACLASCTPNPPAPVSIMVMDKTTQGLVPTAVDFQTINDTYALKGLAATFVGGARIVVDPNDPLYDAAQTDDQLRRLALKSEGADVRLNLKSGGETLIPVDFHSWNMASAYYNYERAFLHFQALAVIPDDEIRETRVFYFPTYTNTSLSSQPLKDNALFDPTTQSFMLLPYEKFQRVPFAMSAGVIAHEFFHRIWHKRIYGASGRPLLIESWIGQGALNVLKSYDEGLADFHAFAASCSLPTGCDYSFSFLEETLGASFAQARRIDQNSRCMDPTLYQELTTGGLNFLSLERHFQLGTVIATALYHAGSRRGGAWGSLEQGALRALSDSTPNRRGIFELANANIATPAYFTLFRVANSIVQHVDLTDPPAAQLLCEEFATRFGMGPTTIAEQMPQCSAASGNRSVCTQQVVP
ncbi:MAG: hypothetical protein ACKVPX_15850 [Myxococcaceae bacterium]